MIVRYLNSKGEEKFIKGILQLQKSNDMFFIALTKNGTELNLRLSGIQGIYLEETDVEKASPEKSPEEKEKAHKTAQIYTDGACKGNPGPGGWGAILLVDGKEIELYGGEQSTTNNRMELIAVIEALSHITEPSDITLTSDSQYVINSIKKGWLENWQKNGWKKADKSPVANEELWKQLLELLDKHNVEFVWIKGHAGHAYNERCDKLATKFARKFSRL